MSRSYRGVRPKGNRVYDVAEVMQLYDVSRNTISNWISQDLRPVDDSQPQLFRGSELQRFREHQLAAKRQPLSLRQLKCWWCKARFVPLEETVFIWRKGVHGLWMRGRCPRCEKFARKPISATQCDEVQMADHTNTTVESGDEYEASVHRGIGKVPAIWWTARNERIIHAYQVYCGRYSDKTVDAHITAIREFEAFHKRKDFGAVTIQDAADYRDELVRDVKEKSRSTLQHRAAHLRTFFRWLVDQDGYQRKLNKTICDYFVLGKEATAKALGASPKKFPTPSDLEQMLQCAPAATLIQRRDRAIFAASFLFGTRSDATASLRLGFIDITNGKVTQDATRMRVKNSKSQITFWFPVDTAFRDIMTGWVAELCDLGCHAEDALFPPDQALANSRRLMDAGRSPIQPWSTDAGVRSAFARICNAAGVDYFPPHSAKHYLGWLRDEVCKTSEQRRAWSQNLGHENEVTTELHYRRVSEERQGSIFADFWHGGTETDEDKELMLLYHEHQLTPGTSEFIRAQKLCDARRAKRKPV